MDIKKRLIRYYFCVFKGVCACCLECCSGNSGGGGSCCDGCDCNCCDNCDCGNCDCGNCDCGNCDCWIKTDDLKVGFLNILMNLLYFKIIFSQNYKKNLCCKSNC